MYHGFTNKPYTLKNPVNRSVVASIHRQGEIEKRDTMKKYCCYTTQFTLHMHLCELNTYMRYGEKIVCFKFIYIATYIVMCACLLLFAECVLRTNHALFMEPTLSIFI